MFALCFAIFVTPAVTAERWLGAFGVGVPHVNQPSPITVRVAPFAGVDTKEAHFDNGGYVIARGQVPDGKQAAEVETVIAATPKGPIPYVAFFVLAFVLAAIFAHHMRRSNRGRLVRVQVVSLISIVLLAVAVKVMLLLTSVSVLVVPVAVLAMVATMVLDRIVGLATGILAALVVALLGPFDLGVAILMLVQASTAGLVVAERPKHRWRSALFAGAVTTVFTAATYVLLTYLTTGAMPSLADPYRSAWLAAAIGPAIAMLITVPLIPIYQLLVGEITQGKLVELEDLSNPLLRQIAEKAPGTWQHSLMMANMAEIAANTIGASGRLVRVGAYYHDLGKSLQPKYFIENLEPGETSPHDQLPPEMSCDAIFAHVTEGIVTARKAGLHERIVDFMHMHHGNGVLEYFWGKTREQGNPRGLSIEQFRYPGHPPQSRETAILAICDAVEAASRTLKKPEPAAIESLVQRIVYGKLHLGQLDESGLSMSDLRRVSDSLRETIRHANHGRIEYPWQKAHPKGVGSPDSSLAQQDASASQVAAHQTTGSAPRLDSLDRLPARETSARSAAAAPSPSASMPIELGEADQKRSSTRAQRDSEREAVEFAETADLKRQDELAIVATAPAVPNARPPKGDAKAKPAQPDEPSSASHEGVWPHLDIGDASIPPVPTASKPTDPAPDLITPSTFAGMTPPAARKRAATLPPTPAMQRRAPTVPPLPAGSTLLGSTGSIPPKPTSPKVGMSTLPGPGAPDRLPAVSASFAAPDVRPSSPSASPPRNAGPPPATDLENAVTNPPPLRRGPSAPPPATRLPPLILEDEPRTSGLRSPNERDQEDQGITTPRVPLVPVTHAGYAPGVHRDPSMDFDRTNPGVAMRTEAERQRLLAARLDAAADSDEWQMETPVVAPTKAELRALLGAPDPTRRQSLDELEALHRATDDDVEPELLPRRAYPTAEVDPDDIEAAIELAPPARNRAPSAIAVAKPKKP